MNYANKIFDMLNIKPFEEFRLKNYEPETQYIFRLTKDLCLECKWINPCSNNSWVDGNEDIFVDLLAGEYEIIKSELNEIEKHIIEFAKLLGASYLTISPFNNIIGWSKKPTYNHAKDCWQNDNRYIVFQLTINDISDINFINWQDNEPYYLQGVK